MSPIDGLTHNKNDCIMVDFCDLVSGVNIMSRFTWYRIKDIGYSCIKKVNLEVIVKLLQKETIMLFASLSSGKNKIYLYNVYMCISHVYA